MIPALKIADEKCPPSTFAILYHYHQANSSHESSQQSFFGDTFWSGPIGGQAASLRQVVALLSQVTTILGQTEPSSHAAAFVTQAANLMQQLAPLFDQPVPMPGQPGALPNPATQGPNTSVPESSQTSSHDPVMPIAVLCVSSKSGIVFKSITDLRIFNYQWFSLSYDNRMMAPTPVSLCAPVRWWYQRARCCSCRFGNRMLIVMKDVKRRQRPFYFDIIFRYTRFARKISSLKKKFPHSRVRNLWQTKG